MSNLSIMTANYDLTKIVNSTAISEPENWLANYNAVIGGYFFVTGLVILGIVLFFGIKRIGDRADSEAAVYASLSCTILALLLFLIDVDGTKLITWAQFVPFMVVTIISLIAHYTSKHF